MRLGGLAVVTFVALICGILRASADETGGAIGAALAQKRAALEAQVQGFFSESGHADNWAVLVCSSRFWLNYRHIANVLSLYRTVKRLGIPDSRIILMLPDDVACNPRNRFPATVYNNARRTVDLYGENVEVDYRGYEVTVENVIRLLTGRLDPSTPSNKVLFTNSRSNIFVYMSGHGGDDFIKFQDSEEISSQDLADAFQQMHAKGRYHEMMMVVETCQANTMYYKLYSPHVLAVGSSDIHENSLSHHPDRDIGVAVIDRFTHYNLEVLEQVDRGSNVTLQQLFDTYDPALFASNAGIRSDLFGRSLSSALVTDFMGGVHAVELTLGASAAAGALGSAGPPAHVRLELLDASEPLGGRLFFTPVEIDLVSGGIGSWRYVLSAVCIALAGLFIAAA